MVNLHILVTAVTVIHNEYLQMTARKFEQTGVLWNVIGVFLHRCTSKRRAVRL